MTSEILEYLKEPWEYSQSPQNELLEKELKREVSSEHALFPHEVVAVARRNDMDDVLFWISKLNCYAIVHLTWNVEDSPYFPKTSMFYSSDELLKYLETTFFS